MPQMHMKPFWNSTVQLSTGAPHKPQGRWSARRPSATRLASCHGNGQRIDISPVWTGSRTQRSDLVPARRREAKATAVVGVDTDLCGAVQLGGTSRIRLAVLEPARANSEVSVPGRVMDDDRLADRDPTGV